MADDDLTFTEQEREFYTAFIRIMEHLKNRAIKAEREVSNLRKELVALREKVEYMTHASVITSTPSREPVGPYTIQEAQRNS